MNFLPMPAQDYIDRACDPRDFILGYTSSKDAPYFREYAGFVAASHMCNIEDDDLEALRLAIWFPFSTVEIQ